MFDAISLFDSKKDTKAGIICQGDFGDLAIVRLYCLDMQDRQSYISSHKKEALIEEKKRFMCGICGKIYFDPSRTVDESEIRGMTDTIRHRGPDDEGYYVQDNVGLGFRRLSIIDLSTGHQPLTNEDGSLWIIFNGEIYNFQELRDLLLSKGHILRTKTDTECILHLYEEFGHDCVTYLRGMFAFAIWNNKNKELFCARDRFGIKPFYYCFDQHSFIFGSEIKAILKAADVDRAVDMNALDLYFTYGYVTGSRTIYSAIRKLLPAHTLSLHPYSSSHPHIARYWDLHFQPDFSRSDAQWRDEIEKEFSESVRLHMISDVPFGAFLSGGIDSSSVVALMARHSNEPVKTFSIGFLESQFNELQYAREVARQYKTDHHERVLEPESVNLLATLVDAYDEPFADNSAIPTYYVSKFAREYVAVALSGDGGDELFAGYTDYYKLRNIERYNFLPSFVSKPLAKAVHSFIPNTMKGKGLSYLLSQDGDMVGAYIAVFNQLERKKLYSRHICEKLQGSYAEFQKEKIIRNSKAEEYVSRMQELDIRSYLVDDILTKVDIVSMQNSLEVRVPFLDHKFVELTLNIPARYKIHNRKQKYIFKKAMSPHLPASVLNHRKQGFTVPFNVWFKKDLKEYIDDRFLATDSRLSDYLNMDYVRNVVNDHRRGDRDFTTKIWSILFFDAWLDRFGMK